MEPLIDARVDHLAQMQRIPARFIKQMLRTGEHDRHHRHKRQRDDRPRRMYPQAPMAAQGRPKRMPLMHGEASFRTRRSTPQG